MVLFKKFFPKLFQFIKKYNIIEVLMQILARRYIKCQTVIIETIDIKKIQAKQGQTIQEQIQKDQAIKQQQKHAKRKK